MILSPVSVAVVKVVHNEVYKNIFWSCEILQFLYSTYTGEWTPVKVSQGDGDSLVKKVIHRF